MHLAPLGLSGPLAFIGLKGTTTCLQRDFVFGRRLLLLRFFNTLLKIVLQLFCKQLCCLHFMVRSTVPQSNVILHSSSMLSTSLCKAGIASVILGVGMDICILKALPSVVTCDFVGAILFFTIPSMLYSRLVGHFSFLLLNKNLR